MSDITPEMIAAGVAAFERWEDGVDYNGGSAALTPDIERLVMAVYEVMAAVKQAQIDAVFAKIETN